MSRPGRPLAALCLAGGLGAFAAGCGTSTASPVPLPPTTPSTITPPSPTVPSFGAPATVLPATAANAMANASGACSAFSALYVRAAGTSVATGDATPLAARAQQFADAAAAGAPGQWHQLAADVRALVAVIVAPAWESSPHQDDLPQIGAVLADCRPLQ